MTAQTLRTAAGASAALMACLMLAACSTSSYNSAPTVAAIPSVVVNSSDLPGNYGLASYHTAEDRERTIEQAKAACGNPYTIGTGANGGVMMHLADQPSQSEVYLKVATDGRTYLGPSGAAGVPQDRLVLSYEEGVLVTDWIDESARSRFGTMVFSRCA